MSWEVSEGGERGGASGTSATPPASFPDHCRKHANVAEPGPCGGCADARKANAAKPRLSLVSPATPARVPHCGKCDETRHLTTPVGVIRCPDCHPLAEEAS